MARRERLLPCSRIRKGDDIPDIGRVQAVSEPTSDGTMHVRTEDGRTVELNAHGIVHMD